MCCLSIFVFPQTSVHCYIEYLSTCDCNLCSCSANLTQQRILEWPLLHIFFLCLNFVSNESSTKEWAWIYVWQKKKKKRKGWSCFFVCAISFACYACCLWRTFQNVSFWPRAANVIYLRIPERVWVCWSTYPMLLFILDFTKGKRLPYSGNIPNAQPPKGVIFIYFYLFLFL